MTEYEIYQKARERYENLAFTPTVTIREKDFCTCHAKPHAVIEVVCDDIQYDKDNRLIGKCFATIYKKLKRRNDYEKR